MLLAAYPRRYEAVAALQSTAAKLRLWQKMSTKGCTPQPRLSTVASFPLLTQRHQIQRVGGKKKQARLQKPRANNNKP
jgi:hypothetical protein